MDRKDFDPDGVGVDNGNYFGFPFTEEDARLVLLSVPWDVTASYGGGAAFGPDAIIEASTQLDFYDPMSPGAWKKGVATVPIDYSVQDRSARLRPDAKKIMESLQEGGIAFEDYLMPRRLERINTASAELNRTVYEAAAERLDAGHVVGLVGGDHSTPLGLIRALAEREPGMGVLHLDAHCDLRDAYEGFEFSHASIMFNVLRDVPQVTKIAQVAVRDFSESEAALAASSGRIATFDDLSLAAALFRGETWDAQCRRIVDALPQEVYVSFDIDALTFENCPHTGTPVSGGLTFNQAVWLLDTLTRSGRRIIGFDVVEVCPAPDERIDAITGARMLWKLCGQTLKSNES